MGNTSLHYKLPTEKSKALELILLCQKTHFSCVGLPVVDMTSCCCNEGEAKWFTRRVNWRSCCLLTNCCCMVDSDDQLAQTRWPIGGDDMFVVSNGTWCFCSVRVGGAGQPELSLGSECCCSGSPVKGNYCVKPACCGLWWQRYMHTVSGYMVISSN